MHKKHRPTSFEEMYGNIEIIESLTQELENKTVQSFLLHGPKGCGKTTLARIIANKLGAVDWCTYEYNISDVGLKDQARKIISSALYAPITGDAKVFIMDESQDSSKGFQNALLKIVEEPPRSTYFIFCTTNPDKIIGPLKSRLTSFKVEPLRRPDMIKLLNKISKKEELNISKDLIKEIVKRVDGCPRDALKLLGQISKLEEQEDVDRILKDYNIGSDDEDIKALCRALLKKEKWVNITTLLKNLKSDPEKVRYAILGYFSAVALNKDDAEVIGMIDCFSDSYMYLGKAGLIRDCYTVIGND